MRSALLLSVPGFLLLADTRLASADLGADCTQTADIERQIKACSVLIDDDRLDRANLATAHMNRATAYARRRRNDAALQDLNAAVSINPQDPLAYYNRGNVHFDLGNIGDAIADYTHAIELHPAFALAHLNRGLAYERRGERNNAAQDLQASATIDPGLKAKVRKHLDRLSTKR